MATKNNRGEFDCYGAADPDEPLFILRAKDELAPHIVRLWALLREGVATRSLINETLDAAELVVSKKPRMDKKKFSEALKCADDMEKWNG